MRGLGLCVLSTSDALTTHIPVLGQVLKSAALGLRDEESGEDTGEHEGGEDLHDVVEPRALVRVGDVAAGSERSNGTLGDDGTDLARSSRDTVRGRPVAGGEALAGHDEGGSVRSPVEEQLDEDVDGQHTVGADLVVRKAPHEEEDGEEDEPDELEGLAADGVDGSNGEPVAGDGTSADENAVTSSEVVKLRIDSLAATVANRSQDGRRVETETVESNIEEQP